MTTQTPAALTPPPFTEVAADLVGTSARQRWISLLRPYAGIALFVLAAWQGWFWALPVIMFGIFVAVVTVTHDTVHRALGLGPRGTDWALFLMGAVLFESGHAYRATHLQHHKTFPSDEDPEGYPAHLSFLGAVLYGPVFLARLWWWALRRSNGRQRTWLLVEGLLPFLGLAAGVALLPVTWTVLAYVVMALVGSWVYPLLTVYLPHHDYGDSPLTQTSTLRGHVIPRVFLELTYHLEHHLYPQVPSRKLGELSRRLDPFLASAGVVPKRVP